jgi:hypothetical protein
VVVLPGSSIFPATKNEIDFYKLFGTLCQYIDVNQSVNQILIMV